MATTHGEVSPESLLTALLNPTLPEVTYEFQGADHHAWTVVHLRAHEALSKLYECTLILAASDPQATPDELLERPAALTIDRGGARRVIQGVVRAVEDIGTTATDCYVRVVIAPALWYLSERTDTRVFQEMSVVDIVREVLRTAGLYQHEGGLVVGGSLGSLAKREYCVQYQETDLDFVRRLLEEEGIPFMFRHDAQGGETFVLVDEDPQWPDVVTSHGATLTLTDTRMNTHHAESVQWFDGRRQVRSTSTTVRDYDFTRPGATTHDLNQRSPGAAGARPRYEYPARLSLNSYNEGAHTYGAHDGVRQAKVRQAAQQAPATTARGRGNVSGMLPGARFTLTGHQRGDLNQKYLITRVEHHGQAWSDLADDVRASEHLLGALLDAGLQDPRREQVTQRYHNQFDVMPDSVPFRPLRETRRPIAHGPHTARVVGPPGEEIHVDHHDRIKVQFHWDRQGSNDDRSSCWIRTSQAWAGAGWGFVFIPRINMEVVVTFLEGDPDRPLVTGCVYNGENSTPYPQPAEKTKSTIKTNSSPTTGGYNEIRFEDAAGKEQMYVQAERDQDTLVKHDRTLTVGRHSTRDIGGDEHITVHQNRVTHIVQNDTFTVDENQDTEIHGPQGQTVAIDNNQRTEIGKEYSLTAGDKVTITVGDSTIVMTPKQIQVSSPTIFVTAQKYIGIECPELIEIKGGLVKINCDQAEGSGGNDPKKKQAQNAVDQMKNGMKGLLAGLPAALKGALKGMLGQALQGVLGSLLSGQMPNLAQLGMQAVGQLIQGVGGAAKQAAAQGISQLAGGAMGEAPFMRDAIENAQAPVNRGIDKSMGAVSSFMAVAGRDPAWNQLVAEHPTVAQGMLAQVARPVMRQELARIAVPVGSGAQGTAMFDAVGAVGNRSLRTSMATMFTAS